MHAKEDSLPTIPTHPEAGRTEKFGSLQQVPRLDGDGEYERGRTGRILRQPLRPTPDLLSEGGSIGAPWRRVVRDGSDYGLLILGRGEAIKRKAEGR
jgi:hypothetical protein